MTRRRGSADPRHGRRSRRPGSRGSHARPEPPRGGGPAGHSPGVDARLNRFISGGSAAPASAPETADQPPPRSEPPRSEPPRSEPRAQRAGAVSEAYASELPDLSGAIPRPPQRKAAPERSRAAGASRGRPAAYR